mgnify:FL=1
MQQSASYKGYATTFAMVKDQIAKRFGSVAADSYNPKTNCFTLRQWNARKFKVKKGEKALKSFTFLDEEDDQNNKRRWRKPVSLFFHTQVVKVEENKSS